MTLNKDDIRNLWLILEKVNDNTGSFESYLSISGKGEYVRTENIDRLISARWPQDVEKVELWASNESREIRVILFSRTVGASSIEIFGLDPDWVSARVKEIDEFVAEHKNWYWIFHNVPTLFTVVLVFAVLVGIGAKIRFDLLFDNAIIWGAFGYMLGMLALFYGIIPLYPFILVNSGRSVKTKIRGLLNWLMLTIVGGLLFNVLSVLWTK
jgi:hypothetical protein